MSTRFNKRKLAGTIPYEAGGRKSLENGLPRTNSLKNIFLRVVVNITIVTAATTAYSEAFWKLIRRVEIVGNKGGTRWSIDGPGLARFAHFLYGNLPYYTAVPTGVGASQTFEAVFPIDFDMLHAVQPKDTTLNAQKHDTLDMFITWGDKNDLYSANAANATINSVTCEIVVHEDTSGRQPLFDKRISMIEKEVTATTDDFEMKLSTLGDIRALLVYADVDGNPSDAVITEFSVKDGSNVFRGPMTPTLEQRIEKMTHDIEVIPAGWTLIDFAPDGELTAALRTKSLPPGETVPKIYQDLKLSCKVTKQTGTNKIRVYQMELIPVAA